MHSDSVVVFDHTWRNRIINDNHDGSEIPGIDFSAINAPRPPPDGDPGLHAHAN